MSTERAEVSITLGPEFRDAVETTLLPALEDGLLKADCRFQDDPPDLETVMERLARASAAVVGTESIPRSVIEASESLEIICCSGTGTDGIDHEAAKKHGVWVTHVPDGNTLAVAEYTVALLFDRLRHVSASCAAVREGRWPLMVGSSFASITVGIVGFGRIGRTVARLLEPLGMSLLVYDVVAPSSGSSSPAVSVVELDTLLRRSDAILLHVPLTAQTAGLISRREVDKMELQPILINVARGGVVDTVALEEALRRGQIRSAALDVFAEEPLPLDNPLRSFPTDRLLLLPHAAAATAEASARTIETVRDQLLAWSRGEIPKYSVVTGKRRGRYAI